MIVPIDLLKPVLDDLRKFGRVNKPARPWLGMYSTEIDNKVVVIGISDKGPAARAELKAGDVILAVKGEKIIEPNRLLSQALVARTRRRRRAAHRPPRGRHLRRGAGLDRSHQAAQGAAAALNAGERARERAMSEAVVDDIVAVLPPLLQSLEALGFIARHLNPPDFGRVMQAAGTPDQALQSVRSRLGGLAGGIRRCTDLAGGGERRSTCRVRGIARGPARQWRSDRGVSRVASRPARAGGAVSAGREIPAGERVFSSIPPCATTPICWRASPRRRAGHRHHSRPQRTRQPRRLLALRAGILYARPRLAAGDGAAWRQRQWPRLPVELAARRAQLWRHPGRAHRDRQ